MEKVWKLKSSREARKYKDDDDDYDMDFSSHEKPLLTIAFLSFAVFLIKLVIVSIFFVICVFIC